MSDQSTALTTFSQDGVFTGIQQFENAQRIGKALASSALVPKEYQGQNGLANTLVAMEIAGRMGLSPLQVMQNLHVIHGRPSWSSQFIIAMVNGCGRFTPLEFVLDGEGDQQSCYAIATDIKSGKELKGPVVSITMAKKEGWFGKTGSKWQTMPDLMLRYRAAAFWGRLFVPEFLVGMKTQEEVIDVDSMEVEPVAAVTVKELNATISSDKNVDTDLVNDALVTHNDAAAEQGAGGDDAVW
jgi:hypothetical protein